MGKLSNPHPDRGGELHGSQPLVTLGKSYLGALTQGALHNQRSSDEKPKRSADEKLVFDFLDALIVRSWHGDGWALSAGTADITRERYRRRGSRTWGNTVLLY